jgi:hypothetical protein
VGLNSLKNLNLTNFYPNNKKNNKTKNNNKVKSKPLELYELAGKKYRVGTGCAMDFRGLFSLVQLLTVRWQCWLLPH